MRILLILLFIVCAANETNNYFYETSIKTEYQVDPAQFPSNNIPKANLYFTIPVENPDEINFTIRILKGDQINFKVKVSSFFHYPNNSEILNGTDNIELEKISTMSEDNHIAYTYIVPTLKKQSKIKYIVFTILNNQVLNYLSIYVYANRIADFTSYNVNYMKEKVLDKITLSQHNGIYLFILENEGIEKDKLIRLKFNKEYSPDIQIVTAGFKERPITQEDLKNEVSSKVPQLKSSKKDNDYTINEYLLENTDVNKEKYIAIAMKIKESLDFMSFYIGPIS